MIAIVPHKNIISVKISVHSFTHSKFLGVSTESFDTLCLVTEYCANGSLDRYIKSHPNMPGKICSQLIKGIAIGMSHLAKQGVVSVVS